MVNPEMEEERHHWEERLVCLDGGNRPFFSPQQMELQYYSTPPGGAEPGGIPQIIVFQE